MSEVTISRCSIGSCELAPEHTNKRNCERLLASLAMTTSDEAVTKANRCPVALVNNVLTDYPELDQVVEEIHALHEETSDA